MELKGDGGEKRQCSGFFTFMKSGSDSNLVFIAVIQSFVSELEDAESTRNKTIADGGITVNFWIIKVHTSN